MNNNTKKENNFIFKTHDRNGNINHTRLFKILFYSWGLLLASFIPLEIYILGIYKNDINPFEELGIFNAFYSFIYYSFAYNFESWEFNILFFSTLTIALIIYFINFIKYRKASSFQKILSSIGFSQYFLTKYNKKKNYIELDLIKGEKMAVIDDFSKAEEKICQQFQREKFKAESFGTSQIRLNFLEPIPDIRTAPKKGIYNKYLAENKLFLGIEDTKGKPIFGTEKEQGKGLFNGHWLIVGGSGSGKSFSVKELLKNVLYKDNFINYNKIYVINFKKSADYNFLKKLNKVEYGQELDEALKMLKKILLQMFNIYYYNTKNSKDNFEAFQTLVIVDEIQTLQELNDSKSLSKIQKNSVQECLSILEMLSSKARAANISLMVILQQAGVNSLPSTAFRQNLRNRFMLKQENITSAHLAVNVDTLNDNNINPLKLKQGQYIYNDTLTNEVKQGLTVFNDYKIDTDFLNNLEFKEDTKKIIEEVESYKKISIKAIEIEREREKALEDADKKTYCDSFEDLENDLKNIFEEAEERLKIKEEKIEIIEEVKKEEIEEIEAFQMPKITSNITEEKETATENEVLEFMSNIEDIEEDENEDELKDLEKEIEELEKKYTPKISIDLNEI